MVYLVLTNKGNWGRGATVDVAKQNANAKRGHRYAVHSNTDDTAYVDADGAIVSCHGSERASFGTFISNGLHVSNQSDRKFPKQNSATDGGIFDQSKYKPD